MKSKSLRSSPVVRSIQMHGAGNCRPGVPTDRREKGALRLYFGTSFTKPTKKGICTARHSLQTSPNWSPPDFALTSAGDCSTKHALLPPFPSEVTELPLYKQHPALPYTFGLSKAMQSPRFSPSGMHEAQEEKMHTQTLLPGQMLLRIIPQRTRQQSLLF